MRASRVIAVVGVAVGLATGVLALYWTHGHYQWHWYIQSWLRANGIALGTLGDWFTAVSTFGTAGIALYIATRDRKERREELHDGEEAQALLVVVTVTVEPSRHLAVNVTNYGSRAILNLTFESAEFDPVPNAQYSLPYRRAARSIPVLDCDRRPHQFWLNFLDENGHSVFPDGFNERELRWDDHNRPDVQQVTARVSFQDAAGNWWVRWTGSKGLVRRLTDKDHRKMEATRDGGAVFPRPEESATAEQ